MCPSVLAFPLNAFNRSAGSVSKVYEALAPLPPRISRRLPKGPLKRPLNLC